MAKKPQRVFSVTGDFQASSSLKRQDSAISAAPKPTKLRCMAADTHPQPTKDSKTSQISSTTTTNTKKLIQTVLYSFRSRSIPPAISPHIQLHYRATSFGLKDSTLQILHILSHQNCRSEREIAAILEKKEGWSDDTERNILRKVKFVMNVLGTMEMIEKQDEYLQVKKRDSNGEELAEKRLIMAQKRETLANMIRTFLAVQQLMRRNYSTPASPNDSIPLPFYLLATEDCRKNQLKISPNSSGSKLKVKTRLPFSLFSEGNILPKLGLPECTAIMSAQLLPHPDLLSYIKY